ncbi:gamma-1-syntrophin isoform X1 [Lates japonicus]|uniref:Gamma-1-syntrophin isoform X1 n=1 Tax=Lates japonicus TaxID=270547 RepID=A0AAD3MBR1_LATJO|nr:gamma-1-syntrophin isoform X1 [Lates japonicus]
MLEPSPRGSGPGFEKCWHPATTRAADASPLCDSGLYLNYHPNNTDIVLFSSPIPWGFGLGEEMVTCALFRCCTPACRSTSWL